MKMTELQDIGMMCLVEYLDALLAAPTDEARSEIVARRQAETAHLPKEWPTMPTFERGRGASLCALRPRHLLMVEEYGFRRDYDRDALQTYFLDNWHELFGPLRRSRALGVPSDQLRKEIIVSQIIALIEGRRREYANKRAGLPRYHHIENRI
jgi:hypothetical protein